MWNVQILWTLWIFLVLGTFIPIQMLFGRLFLRRVETDNSIDLNARGRRGFTLFDYAVSGGRPDLVEILLAKGVNVNSRHLNRVHRRLGSLRIQFCHTHWIDTSKPG